MAAPSTGAKVIRGGTKCKGCGRTLFVSLGVQLMDCGYCKRSLKKNLKREMLSDPDGLTAEEVEYVCRTELAEADWTDRRYVEQACILTIRREMNVGRLTAHITLTTWKAKWINE